MAKDIRQTKVLKHNKEHDIQYNGQRYKQPKVLKHNKEQDMQYNSQRYKTNKSPKTQQRAGHTIQWQKI
jgi:hypothetical protein